MLAAIESVAPEDWRAADSQGLEAFIRQKAAENSSTPAQCGAALIAQRAAIGKIELGCHLQMRRDRVQVNSNQVGGSVLLSAEVQ